MKSKIIAVIGDSQCSDEIQAIAEEVGGLLASKNATVICGGYGGVMEAACKGAKKNGGTTIGIMSGKKASEGNSFIDYSIVTGMRDARNVIIPQSAIGVIAIGGSFGTLSEIGFSLRFNKPIVGLKTWKLDHVLPEKSFNIPQYDDPQKAVEALFDLIQSSSK